MSIAAREKDEKISYGVLDPSAFAEDGGPSLAERIGKGSGNKVYFRPADNRRVAKMGAMGGWDQMRARLVGDKEGRAMIVTFPTCADSIRTVPFLQHDPDRPEDVMTDSEDHAADEWRYACMSRPYVRTIEKPKPEYPSGYRPYRSGQPGDWLTY
jgi:hypothetical protein